MSRPLFRKLDNHLLRVADLDLAIGFYRDRLGHVLLWRDESAAGFALPDTDAELVVHLEIGPETDILVDDVEAAVIAFVGAGGEVIEPPFDIRIGRCARLKDPFGNVLVILDQSKGRLTTGSDKRVTGVERDGEQAVPDAARADRS
jgi:predicted enzyme related to lactoylglutathione lyase